MGTQYSTNPPVTIDVPMSPGALMGHGQLTTIDQSELSSQLGLSLGGSSILPPAAQSPEERLSTTPSPTSSLQEDEPEEFRRVRCCWCPGLCPPPRAVLAPLVSVSPPPPMSSAAGRCSQPPASSLPVML